MMSKPFFAWTVCALLGVVSFAGCDNQLAVVPVSGVVKYEGQPLEFGSVMFQPVAGGPVARGVIQPDGSFQLTTYQLNDGAILGKHLVRITSFETQRVTPAEQPSEALSPSRIPARYNNFKASGLTAEVTAGSGPFHFELTE